MLSICARHLKCRCKQPCTRWERSGVCLQLSGDIQAQIQNRLSQVTCQEKEHLRSGAHPHPCTELAKSLMLNAMFQSALS